MDSAAALPRAGWDACTDELTWIIAWAAAALRQSGRPLSAPGCHLRRWQGAHQGPHASELLIFKLWGELSSFTSSAAPARLRREHRPVGETQSPKGRACMLGDLWTHQLEVLAAGFWSRACLVV